MQLDDMHLKWNEKTNCWYSFDGKRATPQGLLMYAIRLEAENERHKDALHVLVIQGLSEGTKSHLAEDYPKHWQVVEALGGE